MWHRKKHFILLLLSILLINKKISACPTECQCKYNSLTFSVDCSQRSLTEIPLGLIDLNIASLDLSGNYFNNIPKELNKINSLETLILNDNLITELTEDSLDGFKNLINLQLKRNNITNWSKINPSKLLLPAENLLYLYLNENPLTSISLFDENQYLTSPSLQKLYLTKCKITKITNPNMLYGLPRLESLILENNPLQIIPDLISESLQILDVSNTRLSNLNPSIFENLPMLTAVDLSRNHRLSLITKAGTVHSTSLRRLNLAYCNMNDVELSGFDNLLTINLRGNMIRQLNENSFESNTQLENLDLSYNAISFVALDTFKNLKSLKFIDLSFNMIATIERDTFKCNELLTSINLSRNYITRFNRFHGKSVTNLNMSGCEILTINPDALKGFPDISDLDLSNNQISIFPETLYSDSLQTLNLRMCR